MTTSTSNPFDKEWIKLNVGGRQFVTTRSTLCTKETSSMLACMFHHQSPSLRDEHGAYLIDRSPTYFEPILGYLRHGKLIVDHNTNLEGIREEAKFYNVESLIRILDDEIERANVIKAKKLLSTERRLQYYNEANDASDRHNDSDQPALTRRDVVRAIMSTSGSAELRFQGLNLAGANLAKLDLRRVNLKYANLKCACLKGADLTYANLERADLSQANLEGVRLVGANLRHTNLEGANMRAITIHPASFFDSVINPTTHHQSHHHLFTASSSPHHHHQYHNQQQELSDHNHNHHQHRFMDSYDSTPRLPLPLSMPLAQFECANMRSCNLEGSQLAYADLRRVQLNGANLQNCSLQRAALVGADLENCDLTGCDLHEANLVGANFKGALLNENPIQ